MYEFKRPKLPDFRRLYPEQIRDFLAQFSGVFFAVPLGNSFGFGRVIRGGIIGVYDLQSPVQLPIEQIEKAPVLFFAGSAIRAVLGGRRWKILGKKPLTGALTEPVKFFREDIFTGVVTIHSHDGQHSYEGEDLSRLERQIIWPPKGIEERLRNHFAGKTDPNAVAAKYDFRECEKERMQMRANLAAGTPQLRDWVVQFLNRTTEESLRKFSYTNAAPYKKSDR